MPHRKGTVDLMQKNRALAGCATRPTRTNRSSAVRLAAAGVLVATAVLGQTVTGGYSGGHGVSRHVSELPPAVGAGPTLLHHLAVPSIDPHKPDGASQTIPGPLINASS